MIYSFPLSHLSHPFLQLPQEIPFTREYFFFWVGKVGKWEKVARLKNTIIGIPTYDSIDVAFGNAPP